MSIDGINSLTSSKRVVDRILQPKVAPSLFENIAKGVLGAAGSVVTGATGGMPSETMDLLNKQMELQQTMLQVSLISNVSKTKHDTSMSPVRNIRAG